MDAAVAYIGPMTARIAQMRPRVYAYAAKGMRVNVDEVAYIRKHAKTASIHNVSRVHLQNAIKSMQADAYAIAQCAILQFSAIFLYLHSWTRNGPCSRTSCSPFCGRLPSLVACTRASAVSAPTCPSRCLQPKFSLHYRASCRWLRATGWLCMHVLRALMTSNFILVAP